MGTDEAFRACCRAVTAAVNAVAESLFPVCGSSRVSEICPDAR